MKTTADFSKDFITRHPSFKNKNLTGRYIVHEDIAPELEELKKFFDLKIEGFSFLKNQISSVTIGKGETRILAWSQMHGNETTTTKAVFDVLNYLKDDGLDNFSILKNCSIKIIPMLNPDGAKAYTRINANGVDLNRDAFKMEEEESKVLRKVFDNFKPHFCFNLHDQRTIFSAGNTAKPATLSFLAPAMDEKRSINQPRRTAMKIITGISAYLQPFLGGNIGRYDDAYNKNCTGDNFMGLEVPTILFEAGHFPGDYQREETRKYTALVIFSALKIIANEEIARFPYEGYFKIPENQKLFYDVILRNAIINDKIMDIGIQFKEELEENKVVFTPIVQEISAKMRHFGHQEIDCKTENVNLISQKVVKVGDIVHQIRLKDSILSIKSS